MKQRIRKDSATSQTNLISEKRKSLDLLTYEDDNKRNEETREHGGMESIELLSPIQLRIMDFQQMLSQQLRRFQQQHKIKTRQN